MRSLLVRADFAASERAVPRRALRLAAYSSVAAHKACSLLIRGNSERDFLHGVFPSLHIWSYILFTVADLKLRAASAAYMELLASVGGLSSIYAALAMHNSRFAALGGHAGDGNSNFAALGESRPRVTPNRRR